MGLSSFGSELDVDFDSTGDGDVGHFLDLGGGALKIDVSFENGHLEVVPGLGTLTAWSSSAADSQVLVGKSHWTSDSDFRLLGVFNETLGDCLHALETIS